MSQSSTEDSAPDNKGAKRKQASRQRLLDAARKLFVERGYHATRPQDISKEAGLGHGTFYLHFHDKQECFSAFVDQARAEVDAAVFARASVAKNLPEMVEAVLMAIYEHSEANPGVLATALSDETVISAGKPRGTSVLHRWGAEWGKVIALQAEQGLVAKDFDFEVIGQAVVGAIHQASSFSYETDRSPRDLVKSLSKLIVRALTPPK
jgi:AcrR family transcriptional regulator